MSLEPAPPSAFARRHARALVVVTVMVGTISTILAATIVNVAFPAMMRELAIGHDTLQWVSTGFLAATATTMLATAWLIEVHGEQRVFVTALTLFLAASCLGAAGTNAVALITARVLQGAAAGVLQPLAMIALFRVFPVHERGRAMGLYGFGIVLAPAIGPAIGGAMVDTFGWRSIFLLSVPFCVIGLELGRRYLPDTRARARRQFDWPGIVLLAAALVVGLNLPVVGHRAGWLSLPTLAIACASVFLITGFIAREFRADSPLLMLHLFRSRSFAAAALVSFAYGVGLFGSTYLVPVFVQEIAGFDAARAGYLLLPPGIALALAIVAGGRLSDRAPPRRIVGCGLALFCASSLLLALSGATTGFVLLALWLVIGRVGLGLIIPGLNVGAVQALSGTDLAYASAAVNFVRQLGGAVGVNLLAVLLDWRLAVHATAAATAFHECFALVTIMFVVALWPARSIGKAGTTRR
jgi:MFS transporter, DHA2 family, multidrug resistance protein